MSSSSSSSSSFDDPADTNTPTETVTSLPPSDTVGKAITALQSLLKSIIPDVVAPDLSSSASSSSSNNPALSLLHDHQTSSHISSLLRRPNSGAGDNPLCSWLYDTFQTGDQTLQLVVVRFLPIIAGLYLSRVAQGKTCLGFEVILLTLYAHEASCRGGQPLTVNVPDMSHPSIYHDTDAPTKSNSTELNLAVVSPSLEPCGAVWSTKRARIVGVALELYYSKITQIPVCSKIDFCEFCRVWAGQDGDMYKDDLDQMDTTITMINGETEEEDNTKKTLMKEEEEEEEGRILLPWELLQPVLRILGHCILGCDHARNKDLFDAATAACRSLYARSLHDINSKAILATRSLLRLAKISLQTKRNDDGSVVDPTEIPHTNRITI